MRYFWAMEFESVGQVTEQLLNAYGTDRQPSNAEWIITYIGLHWLFLQSSQFATDPAIQERYAAHAVECRKGADAVLAQLPFHVPSTMDYVLALTMAVSPEQPVARNGHLRFMLTRASNVIADIVLHEPMQSHHGLDLYQHGVSH